MSTLDRRLQVLDAMTSKGGVAGDASLEAAVRVLFAGVAWAMPDPFTALMHRINTSTTTKEDRDLLNSLPPCRYQPLELVRLVAEVKDKWMRSGATPSTHSCSTTSVQPLHDRQLNPYQPPTNGKTH